jgi:hypothetical protein
MNITDTITTEEQEIIADAATAAPAEGIGTFCEEVGYAFFENGERRVWVEFHKQKVSTLLTDN